MAAPTRFPSGVVDRGPSNPLGSLPILDPSKYIVFHDDFTGTRIAGSGIIGWHEDAVNAGTSLTQSDAHGGVATFVLDDAQGDNYNYQWANNTTVIEPWKVQSGKKFWLRARIKVEDADQDLVQVGCHVAADDVLGTEPADQFMFRTKTAASATIQFAVGKTAATEVTADLGDLSDNTYAILTAYYDGVDTVYVWNESADGTTASSGSCDVTDSTTGDLLPDTEMTMGFGMEANDTGTDTFTIDFLTIVAER